MTLLNYWHYISFGFILIFFILGVRSSLKQKDTSQKLSMFFATTLVSLLLTAFSIFIVDKYTKEVKLYKLKNKRILGIEKIIYTGIVKNEGKFPIGEVTFEIKLVNKGHATGMVKGGNFFKSSGFFDLFSGYNRTNKPQTVTKRFVVARNLKAGSAKSFRVYFPFPGYFRSVADFAKVEGH